MVFSSWNLFSVLWTCAKRPLAVAVLPALLICCGSNDDEPILPPTSSPLTLLSTLGLGSLWRSDVWGYVDPISNKEYALIGGAVAIHRRDWECNDR